MQYDGYSRTGSYPIDILIDNAITCFLGIFLASAPSLCVGLKFLLVGPAQNQEGSHTAGF